MINRLRVIYKKRNGLKTKLSYKKRSRIRACWRASTKLKNMIKDMHRRVADWLVVNDDVVLIEKLGIGVMKCKRKRRGKRVFKSLSHHSFRRTLQQKATLARKVVRVVSEAYTTKQCSNRCGYMKWTIGCSDGLGVVFRYKKYGFICVRERFFQQETFGGRPPMVGGRSEHLVARNFYFYSFRSKLTRTGTFREPFSSLLRAFSCGTRSRNTRSRSVGASTRQ